MLPFLNLGPIGLPTAPLVYILGVWLALYAVDRAARRLGREPELYYGLASVTLLAGFIGARLVFVLLRWSSFDDNLLGIIWPLTSGYNAAGGVIIGAAAAYFYGRWRRLPLWPASDVLAPGLIIFLMTVSLADLLGGPGYGTLTGLPWGITLYGVRRHPVQIYEILAGLAALGVWWSATAPRFQAWPGRAALMAVAVYAGGRLFVEAFRDNAWLAAGGVRVMQLISLFILLLALITLARTRRSAVVVLQAGE
jgi:phosphatidylglycerol---prolipoprotein diacylglyceryl transferase